MTTSRGGPRLPVAALADGRFQIGSESRPGTVYEVDLAAMNCSCQPDEAGRLCKHLRAALDFQRAREQAEAKDVERQQLALPGLEPPVAAKGRKPRELKLGYKLDEVASALQKEIRHGDEEAAMYWGLLLYEAVPYYAWKRVLITAVEDVGLADPAAVALACTLAQAWQLCKLYSWHVSPHHLSMAIVSLCRAPKSTEVEDLQSYTEAAQKRGMKREMPGYAIDPHTQAGREAGRDLTMWYDARHLLFGIPANRWTRRLFELEPGWFSDEMQKLFREEGYS